MDYFDLGPYSRPVTTTSADAQTWFDRGLNWLYCYNHGEAVVCFQKAIEAGGSLPNENDAVWKAIMLLPEDYSDEALFHEGTRELMAKIEFEHGGEEYDRRYPDGIPTSMQIRTRDGGTFDSGLVMYPSGHARNTTADLQSILATKFGRMGAVAVEGHENVIDRMNAIGSLDAEALRSIWDFDIREVGGFS